MKPGSKGWKMFMSKLYGFGAAVVIVGAMFKIMHWPGASLFLILGLGLDPIALRKLSAMVFRLAFSPCLAETVIVAVASHLLLGFPWQWGFMLGFILAAVSPAVVVPCLLSLQVKYFIRIWLYLFLLRDVYICKMILSYLRDSKSCILCVIKYILKNFNWWKS